MEVTEKTFDTNYRGTAIGIRFTTNTVNNFDEIRQQIVAKGEALSTQIDGAIKSASKSSGGRYHL
ncbi:MAG: hypothetical protein IKF00_03820 [Solobacterium sp.]|nr:hypothetical protein [Solobacterium sp.]